MVSVGLLFLLQDFPVISIKVSVSSKSLSSNSGHHGSFVLCMEFFSLSPRKPYSPVC